MKATAPAKITVAFYITHSNHTFIPLMTVTQIATVNFDSPDGFYNYDATDNNGNMIATIAYDSEDNSCKNWVVLVNDVEIHRTHTVMRAQNYVIWYFNQGTLPTWQHNINSCDDLEIEDAETILDDSRNTSEFLFQHVKRSLVKVTLAIVITSSSIGALVIPAFSTNVPLNGRIGNPQIDKKPTQPTKPHRGGSRREYTPPDNGHPDGTVGSGTR